MKTVTRIACCCCVALGLATTAGAQDNRQAAILGDSGFFAITRIRQDTVTLIAWGHLTRVVLRADSATVARLAADSMPGDSGIRITGAGDTVSMHVTRSADGGCRLDASAGAQSTSVVFDSGAARTFWRVLTAPPATIGFPDSAQRGMIYNDLQVQNAATTVTRGKGPTIPQVFREHGLRGRVVAEFVVDTAGRMRADTFIPLISTDPALAQAVTTTLRSAQWTPATLWGRPVNQIMTRSFDFIP